MPDEPLEEQVGGEPERPDYLLERFNSVDDQARSYAELERTYTQNQQRMRGLEEAYQDLAAQYDELQELQQQEPQHQPYQPPPPGYDEESPLLQMYRSARENDDIAAELRLQTAMQRGLWEAWQQEYEAQQQASYEPDGNDQVVAQLFAMQTEQLIRQQVPDWDEIKGGVHDVIQEHSYLLTDTPEPLEAAGMIRNAVAIYRQQQADLAPPAQGSNQLPAPAGRQQKLQAQTMQGQGLNPGTEVTPEQYHDFIKSQQLEGFKL